MEWCQTRGRPNHRQCVIANAYMLYSGTNTVTSPEAGYWRCRRARVEGTLGRTDCSIAGKTIAPPGTPSSEAALHLGRRSICATTELIFISILLRKLIILPNKCTMDASYAQDARPGFEHVTRGMNKRVSPCAISKRLCKEPRLVYPQCAF